jgi:hypothetical protein
LLEKHGADKPVDTSFFGKRCELLLYRFVFLLLGF